ncbi:MAG: YajQ family cyclic di-GMP-binding protein [Proteobacteria bacterium]|nr:MAG: YajQ family cyclic di-GMP-binding protein [Pseudomonadota bacterium]
MPSFDVVSEVDLHEVRNATDQANKEVTTRFDFKGSNASFELKDETITLKAENTFQLKQMMDILFNKFAKRGVDVGALDPQDPSETGINNASQKVLLKQGLDSDNGKKVVKLLKGAKLKVQAQIQGDQVRVTGKKRDDLQEAIALLRDQDMGIPLQYTNFRD